MELCGVAIEEEPTYITIGPPTCELLENCTLTEKDCIFGFGLDMNGCRTCRCKTSKYVVVYQQANRKAW
ncbi:UNVERIFIED_CONTAM: hypothetical protein FKN15_063520 [Acipenser sinensis]